MPEWREKLPEMATVYPEWSPLIAAWSELEEMWRAVGQRCYGDPTWNMAAAKLMYERMHALDDACYSAGGWTKNGPGSWSKHG